MQRAARTVRTGAHHATHPPLRISLVALAATTALASGGCSIDCSTRNGTATGAATLDATGSLTRTLELTLTPSAYSTPELLDQYRATYLLLDLAPESLDLAAPVGTYDVVVATTRTRSSRLAGSPSTCATG
jgi:hypothetical protein